MGCDMRTRPISRLALVLLVLAAFLVGGGSCIDPWTPGMTPRTGHAVVDRKPAITQPLQRPYGDCRFSPSRGGGWDVVVRLPGTPKSCNKGWGVAVNDYVSAMSHGKLVATSKIDWHEGMGICTGRFIVKDLGLFSMASTCWISYSLRPMKCVGFLFFDFLILKKQVADHLKSRERKGLFGLHFGPGHFWIQ